MKENERSRAVADVITSRRTVPLFDDSRTPPREVVLRALDLACWAPNHKLTQPWRFYLLGPETARRVAHLNAEIVGATKGPGVAQNKLERWLAVPGWVVVTCVRTADPVRYEEDRLACACAVHNASLYLWSEGIGTKWTTGDVTRDERFYELIGIDPSAESVVALLWYGYPALVPVPPPRTPAGALTKELP